ncbi:MAG: SPFH domain-containing protein [Candidatus Bathyarchaeota archaeon]|nr:SPFH domain-containing protein [Candidatus Bathyarchaeota archaeon]MDD4325527.1 SPFH domain-containing protein [Candidatus Bathyarchaeota archaeon]MDT8781915.1 SPFH domain-containing protein [Candidatus Bathyarchaeota archaeon]
MPIIEKVSWDTAGAEDIAYRFPNLSLKYGSQVIVKENQWAVFFRDGKAYDVFGPGRHTITSNNVPLLTAAIQKLGIIGEIFNCEVIYVSNSQFKAKFGGSAYSAPSGDIKYQAELGFYGYSLFKVEEPKVFVAEFFGNKGVSSSEDIANYIRGFVNERVIDEFGEHDIFTLVKNVDETTDIVSLKISDEAARIGIKIVDVVFEGVKIPEEARRFASGMGQQAMSMQYMKETASELKDSQGGGAAAAGLGAGIGLTMPFMMAQQMQQGQAQQPQQVIVCQACGGKNPTTMKFCGNCGASLAPPSKVVCQNCKTENPATMKFCGNCGKALVVQSEVTCAKCGTKNAPGTKFCGNCGEKL